MRHLSVKQKKLLKKEADKIMEKGIAPSCDSLPIDTYWNIFDLNRFENFDADADRFMLDYYFTFDGVFRFK